MPEEPKGFDFPKVPGLEGAPTAPTDQVDPRRALREEAAAVPFPKGSVQPEELARRGDIDLSAEMMFRNLEDSFEGQKDLAVLTANESKAATIRANITRETYAKLEADQSEGFGTTLLRMVGFRGYDHKPSEAEMTTARNAMADAEDIETQTFWKNQIVVQTPGLFSSNMIASVDDLMNMQGKWTDEQGNEQEGLLLPETLRNPEMRVFAETILNQIKRESDARVGDVLPELFDKAKATMVNVDDQTVGQILKNLSALSLPEFAELRPNELRNILVELGYDTTELDNDLKDIRSELEMQLSYWAQLTNNAANATDSAREKMKLTLGQRALMMVSQPALAMGEAFGWYMTNVSQPFAFQGTYMTAWVASKLGSGGAELTMADLRSQYREAQKEGLSGTQAQAFAYDSWDTNWWAKLAGEVLFDPLTYVDLALGLKTLSLLPKTGRLSRVYRALGSFETGYNKAADAPIRAMSRLSRAGLGRSVQGMAALRARQTGQYLIGAAQQHMNTPFINSITADQLSNAGRVGIQMYLRNPRILTDNLTKFGADLWNITRAPFSKADLDNLIIRLNGEAEATDELWYEVVELLGKIDDTTVMADTQYAASLAFHLGSENVDEAMVFLREVIEAHGKAADVLLQGTDLRKVMNAVTKASSKFYEQQYTGLRSMEVIAGQQGAMTGFMRNTYQTISGSKIAMGYNHYVDRMFVLPFARQVLLFGGYAPMNLVESMIRVTVAGYAPWKGWADNVFSHRDISPLFLQNIPPHLLPMEIADGPLAKAFMEIALEAPNTSNMLWTERLAAIIPGVTRDVKGGLAGRNFNLGSMQSFNDWAARVATEHRAFIYRQMYSQNLFKVAPNEVEAISAAVGKLVADDYSHLSKEEIKGLQTLIELSALTDPQLVRNLQVNRELLTSRKLVSDSSKALDELTLIDEFGKRAILDVIRSGQMTQLNSAEILEEVLGKLMEGHVGKLFRSTQRIAKVAADIETWVPANRVEVLRMIDQLRQLENEVIPRAVEDAYAATTIRGRQILSNTEREQLHADSQQLIRNFIIESETHVKNMHKRLKEFESMLTEGQITAMNQRVASWERRLRRLREVRAQSFQVLSDYASQGPRLKSPEGWQAAYAEAKVFWDAFWIEDGRALADTEAFMQSLMVSPPKVNIRAQIPEMQAGLTLEHVSTLFGVTPDQVTQNLMSPETATMMGRERFINYVRAKAGVIAGHNGIQVDDVMEAANAMGYTDDAVGQVYDNILMGMGIDPADIPQMGPMAGQVRGFGQNYNDMYESRMVPMDDVNKLNEHLSGVADRLSELDMYKEVVETPGWTMPEGTYLKVEGTELDRTYQAFEGDISLGHAKITRYGDIPKVSSFFPDHPMPSRMQIIDDLGVNVDTANELILLAQTDMVSLELDTIRLDIRRIADRYDADYDKLFSWAMDQRVAIEKMQQKALKPLLNALVNDIGIGNTFDTGSLLTGGRRLTRTMHREGVIEHVGAVFMPPSPKAFGDLTHYDDQIFRFVKVPKAIAPPRVDVTVGPTAKWNALREEAAKGATNEYHQTFTEYGDTSMFGNFMKKIYPFWTYESQRLPWIAQAYMRRPTLGLNMNRYMDYTDGGYVRLPFTDLEVNPFRGTVFMGGLRRLWVKDFPEYYDSFPFASGAMDYFSRYGFYPNTGIGIVLATFGTKVNGQPEYGEVLAPWVRTALNLGASVPSKPGRAVQWFRDRMFPDRFRSYLISQKAILAGEKGMDIFAKIELDIPLTAAEKQAWSEAERYISWNGLLMEQTGMIRFRPEERDEAYRMAEEVMAEILNIDVKLIQKIRRYYPVTGKSVFDLFNMTPAEMAKVYEMEEYMKWNSGLTTPLLPSEWRAQDTKRILYFSELDKIDQQANITGFVGFAKAYDFTTGEAVDPDVPISHEWLDQMLRSGKIDGNTFNSLSGELYAMTSAQKTAVSNQEVYKDVPKTLEERRIRREERGKGSSSYHPAQELIWLYHEVTPKFDAATASYDWDTFFMQQSAILGAVPDHQKVEFEANLMKDWTPSRKRRWQDYKDYMQPYYSVRLIALQQFNPEQVNLIETYKRQPGSIEGRRIREEEMFDVDTKLVAHYEALVSQGHENIRKFDPTTDGVLRYWGVVTSSLTPEGETEYLRILREYQR